MEVLLWLVPAGIATGLAMTWAAWTGRRMRRGVEEDRRTSSPGDDERARARLGAALARPVPTRARHVVAQVVDRGTGVAMRRASGRPEDRPARGAADRR